MNGRIERSPVLDSIRYLDPDVERRRIALGEIEDELREAAEAKNRKRNERIARVMVYTGLLAFCTAFWAGVIWWLER